MTPFSANPLVYIVPAIVLAVVVLYYVYGALDRMGLDTRQAVAVVTGKQFAPGSTMHRTNIVAGRAWTQSYENPDSYVVTLEIDGQAAGGVVSQPLYESLSAGDRVRVRFQRTRFSNQIVVTDVSR